MPRPVGQWRRCAPLESARMAWLMSMAQDWRLVCAESDFRRFSLVSFAVCFVRNSLSAHFGLKSLTVTCKEGGISPSPSDKYSSSNSGSTAVAVLAVTVTVAVAVAVAVAV
jgi:hypothetical protein